MKKRRLLTADSLRRKPPVAAETKPQEPQKKKGPLLSELMKTSGHIEIAINGRTASVSRNGWPLVAKILSYQKPFWKQGPFGRKAEMKDRSFLDSRNGKFPAGLLSKVLKVIPQSQVTVNDFRVALSPIKALKFEGLCLYDKKLDKPVEYRQGQKEGIDAGLAERNGVIIMPTGGGKTLVGIGVMIAMAQRGLRCIFLAPTKDLFWQAIEDYERFADSKKFPLATAGDNIRTGTGDELCAIGLVNTVVNLKHDEWWPWRHTDGIIVDECHRVDADGMYAHIFFNSNPIVLLGLTATFPKEPSRSMAIQGWLGGIIWELTFKEQTEQGIIAHGRVILLMPNFPTDIEVMKYREARKHGIVHNAMRNGLFAVNALKIKKMGLTSLMLVREVEHGKLLLEKLKLLGIKSVYIWGKTEGKVRQDVKHALTAGEYECVIATVIWKEGVNIPPLGAILNPGGGKSEQATIQAIGRGLRTTDEKTELIVVDSLDCGNRYLAEHSCMRVATYVKLGWLSEAL